MALNPKNGTFVNIHFYTDYVRKLRPKRIRQIDPWTSKSLPTLPNKISVSSYSLSYLLSCPELRFGLGGKTAHKKLQKLGRFL
jgi:hypothetical protein